MNIAPPSSVKIPVAIPAEQINNVPHIHQAVQTDNTSSGQIKSVILSMKSWFLKDSLIYGSPSFLSQVSFVLEAIQTHRQKLAMETVEVLPS